MRKSQLLEAELEKTSGQLKDATELAADEAEKCNAAKEVIKSLTGQVDLSMFMMFCSQNILSQS